MSCARRTFDGYRCAAGVWLVVRSADRECSTFVGVGWEGDSPVWREVDVRSQHSTDHGSQ